MESVDALYTNKEYFPSGILSAFGYNEGVQKDKEIEEYSDHIDLALPDSDMGEPGRETYLRYAGIIILYCAFPLIDIISDFIITGVVHKQCNLLV